jgi:hypothetical protein
MLFQFYAPETSDTAAVEKLDPAAATTTEKLESENVSYLNMLDAAQPFELMPNPFCCTGFLRVEHHHKRLIWFTPG